MPENSHVLSALTTKRAELAGNILQTESALAKLHEDLASIDNAIRVFDPDSVPERIRPKAPKSKRYPFHIRRTILGTLRRADRPLTVQAIAEKIAQEQKMEIGSSKSMAEFTRKVRNSLSQNHTGLTRTQDDESGVWLWRVATAGD